MLGDPLRDRPLERRANRSLLRRRGRYAAISGRSRREKDCV